MVLRNSLHADEADFAYTRLAVRGLPWDMRAVTL